MTCSSSISFEASEEYSRLRIALRSSPILLAITLCSFCAQGTHIRAGEIQATLLQGLTYQFTLFGYTDAESPIIFAQGLIDFGDGSTPRQIDQLAQEQGGDIINLVEFNKVVVTHTFAGPGRYTISYMEANRNADILNMDNSVNTPFYVETQIIIDPLLGPNNSPELLVPPIDEGAIGTKFLHNPGAFDIDGDSLSYMVVTPNQDRGLEVINYIFPNDPKFGGTQEAGGLPTEYSLDAITGDVVWDAPGTAGEYGIAFIVEEWRIVDGQTFRMGYVTRDMQIVIKASVNERPDIAIVPGDTCLVAGDSIAVIISADDFDGQHVTIEAFGEPLELLQNPATFDFDILGNGLFHWKTDTSHARSRWYQVVFKATDTPPPTPALVDFKNWFICVTDSTTNCILPGEIPEPPEITGIEDLPLPPEIRVYPNPFSDRLVFEFDPTPDLKELTITLYSLSGELIWVDYVSRSYKAEIQTQGLLQGVYLYTIAGGEIRNRGIVIKR